MAKKRKVEAAGSFSSQSLTQQPSFADVLERLREEGANGNYGTSRPVDVLKGTIMDYFRRGRRWSGLLGATRPAAH